jgi:DNA-binding XRE family transcriptional regulator
MASEIPWELREEAEELYIIEGLTYDDAAKKTGISVQTLKKWGAAEGWAERKHEYRESLKSIRTNMTLLRQRLAAQAATSLDPQAIYALVRLQNAAVKDEKKTETADTADRPRIFLENLEFVAGVLKDQDPEGLRVLAKNFDLLIAEFKRHHEAQA